MMEALFNLETAADPENCFPFSTHFTVTRVPLVKLFSKFRWLYTLFPSLFFTGSLQLSG